MRAQRLSKRRWNGRYRKSAATAADFLYRPFQRRFDRRCALIDVRTVETEAGLGAKAVAGAETDEHHRRILQQRSRDLFRVACGNADLESIFTGIAGPTDEAARAGDRDRPNI